MCASTSLSTRIQQSVNYSQNVFSKKPFESRAVSYLRPCIPAYAKKKAVACYQVSHLHICLCCCLCVDREEESLCKLSPSSPEIQTPGTLAWVLRTESYDSVRIIHLIDTKQEVDSFS